MAVFRCRIVQLPAYNPYAAFCSDAPASDGVEPEEGKRELGTICVIRSKRMKSLVPRIIETVALFLMMPIPRDPLGRNLGGSDPGDPTPWETYTVNFEV